MAAISYLGFLAIIFDSETDKLFGKEGKIKTALNEQATIWKQKYRYPKTTFSIVLIIALILFFKFLGIIFSLVILSFYAWIWFRAYYELQQIKQDWDMKKFTEKYQEAIKKGDYLPKINLPKPKNNIREASNNWGWWNRLKARDAAQIADYYQKIAESGEKISASETKTLINLKSREAKIAEELKTIERKSRSEDIDLEMKEMRLQELKDKQKFNRQENSIASQRLKQQLAHEKTNPSFDQAKASESEPTPYQEAYQRERNKGQSQLGRASGIYDNKKDALKIYQEKRDNILRGRAEKDLTPAEQEQLEDLEDYFLNQVLPRLN